MPTYDYGCSECSKVQEEIHSIKESPEIACKSCGHKPMHRHICTNPEIIFRGEWPGKSLRVDGQMRSMLNTAEKRQAHEWGHLKQSKIAPNVDGVFTGEPNDAKAWRDAGKLAQEKGYDANSYEEKAHEIEQKQRIPDHLKESRVSVGGSVESGVTPPVPKSAEKPVKQTPAVVSSSD